MGEKEWSNSVATSDWVRRNGQISAATSDWVGGGKGGTPKMPDSGTLLNSRHMSFNSQYSNHYLLVGAALVVLLGVLVGGVPLLANPPLPSPPRVIPPLSADALYS